MRYGLLCVALTTLLGCDRADAFSCSDDASCGAAGAAGRCEASGFCSFEDLACPSGRRFGALAGDGMADECVAGQPVPGGTTGEADPKEGTGPGESGHGSTSGGPEIEEPWGSSGDSGDSGSSSTRDGGSSGASEESSTGAQSYGCAEFDFEGGPIPFDAQSVSISVDVLGGQLLASWPADESGSALFEVAHGVDLSQGALDVSFADIAEAPEGTTASLRWTDASNRIIAAVLEGTSYAVSYYDPMLPEDEQTAITLYPVQGREAVQIGTQGGSIVVKAGQGDALEILTTIEGSFELTDVDVGLFFDRYAATDEAASIGLESLSLCAE